MHEWQVAGAKGRKSKQQPRRVDSRIPSSDGCQALPINTDARRYGGRSLQQSLQDMQRHKEILQQSQLLKAVKASFHIAEADTRDLNTAWKSQDVQQLVVWGLGSLTSGAVLFDTVWIQTQSGLHLIQDILFQFYRMINRPCMQMTHFRIFKHQ